jgi:CTP:phosphocholine cytidylyltransferase-like protein
MKLNIDCIKDILTKTEDVTDFVQKFFYESKKVNELFPGYTHDEIIYHINQASESGLIKIGPFYDGGDSVYIIDLTPEGHAFLANIRIETVWRKIKRKAIESLPVVISLAKDFAIAYFQAN